MPSPLRGEPRDVQLVPWCVHVDERRFGAYGAAQRDRRDCLLEDAAAGKAEDVYDVGIDRVRERARRRLVLARGKHEVCDLRVVATGEPGDANAETAAHVQRQSCDKLAVA